MYKRILFLPVFILLLIGCTRNELDVDIADIDVKPLEILRLEDDIFSVSEANFEEKNKAMNIKYGPFYEHYVTSFLNKGGVNDSLYRSTLLSFNNDKDMKETYAYVKKLYPKATIE